MDFEKKAAELLSQAKILLPEWMPGGKVKGQYYECASIHGGEGDSFKVNLENGLWSEFNGGQSGRDLIALYAAIHGLTNGQALIRLDQRSNFLPAPVTVKPPTFFAIDGKPPAVVFEYRNRDNSLNFYVARYHKKDGSKAFMPWSWDGQKWVLKAWTSNRTLYGLEKLRDDMPVMIVEGEKKVLAGREVVRELYDILSPSGGCKAFQLSDFSPVYGRKVILWPDADHAGISAMKALGKALLNHCPEVKIIDPSVEPDSRSEGWDIADAVAEGWNLDRILEWGGPRCYPLIQEQPDLIQNHVTITDETNTPAVTPMNLQARWIEAGIQQNKNLQPILNEDNVLRIFDSRYGWGQFIWWDSFHKKYFTDRDESLATAGRVREWTDADLLRMFVRIQREWGFAGIKYAQIERAVTSFANDCIKNEPVDWVRELKWDGKARVDTFFIHYMGVKPSKYMLSISHNFWVSLLARLFRPGCQADYMCVFVGGQGIKKTKTLRAIGGNWYASVRATVGTPQFYSAIQGKLLCEIAELEAFSKAGIEAIKEMLTCTTDRYRIPYSKYHADFERSCIFVGTTNDPDFHGDMTGGRRFWPLKIGTVDYDAIVEDREQLFAEALVKFQAGETWYEFDTEEMNAVLEGYRINDPWEGLINEYIQQHKAYGISMDEIFREVLHIENSKRNVADQRRVGKILRFFGWNKKGGQTKEGYRIVWYPLDHDIWNEES